MIVLVLYSIIYLDYNATYTTTYKESANIRTDIAESLQSLPLSYFSSHDLSDLSQTIMSDVERLEHALSHAISKTIGFVFFFVLASLMMLLGNPIMGLCIILPLLLITAMIWLSKELPKRASGRYWKQLRDNSESFQEAIELQEEIKAYNLGPSLSQKLYRQMEESERIHLKTEILQSLPILAAGVGLRLTLGLVGSFRIPDSILATSTFPYPSTDYFCQQCHGFANLSKCISLSRFQPFFSPKCLRKNRLLLRY